MIWFLRGLFLVVLGSMLGVTTWAGAQQPLGEFVRSAAMREPWVIATLLDAYWGFVAFFVWVAWKEQALTARVLWFLSLIALGNIAIAAYMLRELFAIPASGPVGDLFIQRRPGHPLLPGLLAALSVAVYLLA